MSTLYPCSRRTTETVIIAINYAHVRNYTIIWHKTDIASGG